MGLCGILLSHLEWISSLVDHGIKPSCFSSLCFSCLPREDTAIHYLSWVKTAGFSHKVSQFEHFLIGETDTSSLQKPSQMKMLMRIIATYSWFCGPSPAYIQSKHVLMESSETKEIGIVVWNLRQIFSRLYSYWVQQWSFVKLLADSLACAPGINMSFPSEIPCSK